MIGLVVSGVLACQPMVLTDIVLDESTQVLTVVTETHVYQVVDGYWSAAEQWSGGDRAELCGHTLTDLTNDNESVQIK